MKLKYCNFDLSRSLTELEGYDWGEQPPPDKPQSNLVKRMYRLRRVPLQDFTVEDIRVLVGQNLSLDYVMPMAIEYLLEDPWRPGGSRYPQTGDLLRFVLTDKYEMKRKMWEHRPDLWAGMQLVIKQALAQFSSLSKQERDLVSNPNPHYERTVLDLLTEALNNGESPSGQSAGQK